MCTSVDMARSQTRLPLGRVVGGAISDVDVDSACQWYSRLLKHCDWPGKH